MPLRTPQKTCSSRGGQGVYPLIDFTEFELGIFSKKLSDHQFVLKLNFDEAIELGI